MAHGRKRRWLGISRAMNEPRAREDCASRQKHLRDVKHKLFMKIIGGPKIGLLFPSREPLTSDVDCAVEQILRALKKVGLEARRETLRLKLRAKAPAVSCYTGQKSSTALRSSNSLSKTWTWCRFSSPTKTVTPSGCSQNRCCPNSPSCRHR